MLRWLQKLVVLLALTGATYSASAIALLGPYTPWQLTPGPTIGYNPGGNTGSGPDIGGPMNITEGYRWNIKTIYYAFDPTFVKYFGTNGMNAINQAVAIINALPPMSKLSPTLSEYATDTMRVNRQAAALGIIDLKSYTLSTLMEEMGLASPDRYTFCIRDTETINTTIYYSVLNRNFDPVTLLPSHYVNDVLYTYSIVNFPSPPWPQAWVDAVELPVDPTAVAYTAVASVTDSAIFNSSFTAGSFFTGLTRDDVGALRYLYSKYNYAVENLVTNVLTNSFTGGVGGSPWTPVGGGIGGSTNSITVALRPGVDKIIFQQAKFDSTLGNFVPFTNSFTDTFILGGRRYSQRLQRDIVIPDILFAAGDLGVNVEAGPVFHRRTDTAGWANNSALNSLIAGNTFGPGVIEPGVVLTYSTAGPWLLNAGGDVSFLDEANILSTGAVWGSFDGTTNAPITYPANALQQLEGLLSGH